MDNEHQSPPQTPDLKKDHSAESSYFQQEHNGDSPYSSGARFSDEQSHDPGPLKQSRLGIASFIIALAAVVLIIVSFVIASANAADFLEMTENYENTVITTEEEAQEILGESLGSILLIGITMIGSIGIAFIGLILGFIGIFAKNRKKAFAIIGLILNALIVLGAFGLVVVGIIIGGAGAV